VKKMVLVMLSTEPKRRNTFRSSGETFRKEGCWKRFYAKQKKIRDRKDLKTKGSDLRC